jgi:hypothetical protein
MELGAAPAGRAEVTCARAATGAPAGHYDPARCLQRRAREPAGRQDVAVERREASVASSLIGVGAARNASVRCFGVPFPVSQAGRGTRSSVRLATAPAFLGAPLPHACVHRGVGEQLPRRLLADPAVRGLFDIVNQFAVIARPRSSRGRRRHHLLLSSSAKAEDPVLPACPSWHGRS